MASARAVAQGKTGIADLNVYKKENEKVVSIFKQSTGILWHTTVKGFSKNFSIDVKKREIYVMPGIEKKYVRGFLSHENGHAYIFPTAIWVHSGFISVINAIARKHGKSFHPQLVTDAANVVADVFADLYQFIRLGNKEIAVRVPRWFTLNRDRYFDFMITYKALAEEAIHILYRTKKTYSIHKLLDIAEASIAKKGYILSNPEKAKKLVLETYRLVRSTPLYVFRMFVAEKAVDTNLIEKLAEITYQILVEAEKEDRRGGTMEESDIGGEMSSVDIELAVSVYQGTLQQHGEKPEPEDLMNNPLLARAVDRFLKEIAVDIKTLMATRTTTKTKITESTELWINPMGDIDEESMLVEKHKLLWKVTYSVPYTRKGMKMTEASPPEKAVVVLDESGSTSGFLGESGITVRMAEALTAMAAVYSLRKMGGAKEITVIKFSDFPVLVYTGPDLKKAIYSILMYSEAYGLGTEIVDATKFARKYFSASNALILLTDALISPQEAEEIAKIIGEETRRKRLGFGIFFIVNALPIKGVLDKIVAGLPKDKSVVGLITSPEDLVKGIRKVVRTTVKAFSKQGKH